jgi:DNA polymerase-3 subunit alpha
MRNGEVELLPAKGQFKNHLTILARDAEGYRNLNRIVTQSYLDYYYHPTVSGHSLHANREGLAILSGCTGSLLACTLIGGKGIPGPTGNSNWNWDDAVEVIAKFKAVFGEWYFLEVQPFYELEAVRRINPAYEILSEEMGVPLVVTHDVHYPTMDDAEMQAVLHAVHRGAHTVDDQLREWNYDVPLTLPSSDKSLAKRLVRTGMSRDAAYSAVERSAEVASLCNVTLPKAERLKYPISEEDLVPWK